MNQFTKLFGFWFQPQKLCPEMKESNQNHINLSDDCSSFTLFEPLRPVILETLLP
jgi:hypothetical protein